MCVSHLIHALFSTQAGLITVRHTLGLVGHTNRQAKRCIHTHKDRDMQDRYDRHVINRQTHSLPVQCIFVSVDAPHVDRQTLNFEQLKLITVMYPQLNNLVQARYYSQHGNAISDNVAFRNFFIHVDLFNVFSCLVHVCSIDGESETHTALDLKLVSPSQFIIALRHR